MNMHIYEPAEDSYFFAEFLSSYFSSLPKQSRKELTFLDMGTGSGILAKTATKYLQPKNVTAVDINEQAIKNLKSEPFNAIHSDLFKNIKQSFDSIIFNAPYLPHDSREPKDSQIATTGGKQGDEIAVKFLQQAKSHLKPQGKIFLLISSLTPMSRLSKFSPVIVARKKIAFEELRILEFE